MIRVEVAVVGSADFVTGFLLAGVRKTFITTDADLEPTLKEVLKGRGYRDFDHEQRRR